MTAVIVLAVAQVDTIRAGDSVNVIDSTGRWVRLYPWASQVARRGDRLYVDLSAADLDLIVREPEGLVVADAMRSTGWTVRTDGVAS